VEPVSSQKIIYCVTDNAGNVTRGQYPENAVNYYGCFADGTMNPLPNLSSYTPPLIARITGNIFGYSLTDGSRATQNAAFQTRLTQNISTYITAQHDSTSFTSTAATLSLNLSNTPGAFIDNTSTPNTNGYHYYDNLRSVANARLNISKNANADITTPKVVYVLGADVQINSDILTSGNGSVVIIVKKVGANGGNIYIDPSVQAINATLIADGALMNRTNNSNTSLNWLTETERQILDDKKLVINGRLFTYNNRGGSIFVQSGNLTP
jgi:hypothetical protein